MHGVTHFMGQRQQTVQLRPEVQQHVGMHPVGAAVGVCAGGLALVFVYVDPAAVLGGTHHVLIVLAQGRNAFQQKLVGLVEAQFHLEILGHGRV